MHDPHSYMGTVDTLQWEQEWENVINSWLTLCYMNGAHFHGYITTTWLISPKIWMTPSSHSLHRTVSLLLVQTQPVLYHSHVNLNAIYLICTYLCHCCAICNISNYTRKSVSNHVLYMINGGDNTILCVKPLPTKCLQNTHDFGDGCKNMNGIFNDYVCSASHMPPGGHFQNV